MATKISKSYLIYSRRILLKNIWNKNKNITDFIAQKEKEMEGLGRVLVRTSGTEPLVRVMVEGKEMNMVEKVVNEIAEVVKKELA